MTTINTALKSLYPNAPENSWEVSGDSYEGLAWRYSGIEKPSKEVIEQKILELKNEWNASLEYRSRSDNYPSIQDQLDMLWHSMNNDSFPKSEPFYSIINNIKLQYPKPE